MDTDNLVPHRCPICVDCRGGGKPEYPEKNPRITEEINYGNSLTGERHTPGLVLVVRGATRKTL